MSTEQVVDQINDCIEWLNAHDKSHNLVEICQVIDKLAVLSVSVGEQVSEAYALMNDLEDEYNMAYAQAVSQSSLSVAKAEAHAEATIDKSPYTTAKNAYKRLSIYLERIDRVIESYRQLVSVSKMDMKFS